MAASLGDASLNHSTAAGAINAAAYCAYQHLPLPLLLVIEDNGIGISVRTPPGWVRAAAASVPRFGYFQADGSDLAAVYDAALAASAWVRERRSPAFLHLSVVRFGGHAGSDVETSYRGAAALASDLAADPLIGTARLLVSAGILTPAEVSARYEESRARILGLAAEVAGSPRLATADQVMAPLAPHHPEQVWAGACLAAEPARREEAFAGRLPEAADGLTLAQSINAALADALAARPGLLVFGEDVARKGGVYGVTRGLAQRFGSARVFDTLLDEQSILGLALGPAWPACCRSRKSSTWPICTTRPIRSAVRPRPCRSSPRRNTGIRWCCVLPPSPIRKVSAAISTTTMRWPACGIFPA